MSGIITGWRETLEGRTCQTIAEFKLKTNALLKLLNRKYSLTEYRDHWHRTFIKHLMEELSMPPTTRDLSLFSKTAHGMVTGLHRTEVDDTLKTGDKKSEKDNMVPGVRFELKPRNYDRFLLPGIQISKKDDGTNLMYQTKYADNLNEISIDAPYTGFRGRRHELAGLMHARPDLTAAVSMLSQVSEAI